MKGWEKSYLGEIAQVGAGNPAPQDQALFEEGTHPFFRTADAGRVRFGEIFEAKDLLNSRGVQKLTCYPKGTILFPKSGASTFLNHRVMLGVTGYVSSHLATIIADKKIINEKFLLYFLSTVAAQDLVQDQSYPSLNKALISGIEVTYPDLTEQQRIVALLDEAFAGLETLRANAEKSRKINRELLQIYMDTLFSVAKTGWKKGQLADIGGSVYTGPFGSILHKSDYRPGGIPLVNPINLIDGKICPDSAKAVGESALTRLKNYILNQDDIVVGRRGEIGRCAVVTAKENGWLCGTGCFFIRTLKSVDPYFLAHLLSSNTYRSKLEALSSGATMQNLNNTALSRLEISIPDKHEQRNILGKANLLMTEFGSLDNIYQQKLAAIDELKQSILHQAFSGQLIKSEGVAA